MSLSRREFIKVAGIGTLAAVSGCTKLSGFMDKRGGPVPPEGIDKWIPSVCGQCPDGCGMLVRVIDGRVVKIEGNPVHPVNKGTICARGQAGLQVLYDPDRIRSPLRRIGARGDGRWKEISWDEAVGEVAAVLRGIRQKGEAHTISLISGVENGLMQGLLGRFMGSLGSPNYILASDRTKLAPFEAIYLTQGIKQRPLYDISNCSSILSFGAPLLESSCQTLREYGDFRRGKGRNRGKLIHIGPRLSVTGIKSDRWIPAVPGTEGEIALSIASVIIKEGLFDRDFISRYTTGFDRFVDIAVRDYTPSAVSKTTGVSEDLIVNIAREFAHNRPSIAISGSLMTSDQIAIHCLNALAGSINKKGGIYYPDYEQASIEPISEWLTKGSYKTNALLIYKSNFLFNMPNPGDMYEALKGIPFIVSFSPFMDETTGMADMVLPDNTYLESSEIVDVPTANGVINGFMQPVIKPLYRTMHTGDVILRIAKEAGAAVGSYKTFEDVLFERLRQIHGAGKGYVFGEGALPQSFDGFIKAVQAGGGFVTPLSRVHAGVFNFRADLLKKGVSHHSASGQAGGGSALHLHTYRPLSSAGIIDFNQPWLKESFAPEVPEMWNTWVEINPATAKRQGINSGDMVWVESPVGRIRLKARLYPGIHPSVVAVPSGLGEAGEGRWNKGVGINPLRILAGETDPVSGNTLFDYTRVKVYKA